MLTTMNVPAGGVARPNALFPQQARVPLVLIAQVWTWLALTAVKVPAGGVDLPSSLLPQQASVPSVLTPQLCQPPALSAVKVSAGGIVLAVAVVAPTGDRAVRPEPAGVLAAGAYRGEGVAGHARGRLAWCAGSRRPSRPRCRSIFIAQACWRPAVTAVKVPAGGVAWPGSSCPSMPGLPSCLSAAGEASRLRRRLPHRRRRR